MSILSGVPQLVAPGEYIGGTDFSEYSVGVGIPADWTQRGTDDGQQPTLIQIGNDPVEGNFLAVSGQTVSPHWRATYDNFDVVNMQFGEMLIRCRVALGINGRTGIGGCWGSSGTTVATLITSFCGRPITGTGPTYSILPGKGTAGLVATFGTNPFGAPIDDGNWFWMRLRCTPGTNPATQADIFTKGWHGSLAAEPVAFVGGTDIAFVANPAAGSIGILMSQFVNATVQEDVAYLAFSTDPITYPTPVPSDIVLPGGILAPTVTVDPLQATFVGLKGTPFTVV